MYKLLVPHSSYKQHGPRVRALAAWPCSQSTRIATQGTWIIFVVYARIVVVCHHRHVPKLGYPAIPAHIILQCFQGGKVEATTSQSKSSDSRCQEHHDDVG